MIQVMALGFETLYEMYASGRSPSGRYASLNLSPYCCRMAIDGASMSAGLPKRHMSSSPRVVLPDHGAATIWIFPSSR